VQASGGDCCDELLEFVVVDTKKSTVELFAVGQVIRLQLKEWNTDIRSEQEGWILKEVQIPGCVWLGSAYCIEQCPGL